MTFSNPSFPSHTGGACRPSRGVSSVFGGVVLLVFVLALFVGGLAALLWLIKTLWFWV